MDEHHPSLLKAKVIVSLGIVVNTAIRLVVMALITWLVCLVFGWKFVAVYSWVAVVVIVIGVINCVQVLSAMFYR